MPKSVKQFQDVLVELAVAMDDDPAAITVQYRPHNMTANHEVVASKAAAEGRELQALVAMVIPVVGSWDLRMEEDGDIVPITTEGLSDVPSSILLLVLDAIGKDRTVQDPKVTAKS